MENKIKYIKISDFAKLCKTNRKTLIYYDREGVFKPKHKDEKGYRYYDINQYETFNILRELREIGVSIMEIKEYLVDRNHENYLKLLKREKEKIEEKVKNLNKIIKNVENKICTTEEGIREKVNLEPYIKFIDEEYYETVDVLEVSEKGIIESIINLVDKSENEGTASGCLIGAILKKEDMIKGEFTNISKLIMKVENSRDSDLKKKEKGYYGIINHKGDYNSTYKSYKKLLEYIENEGLTIVSDSYEEGLLEYISCQNDEDLLTRISIRVEKNTSVNKK